MLVKNVFKGSLHMRRYKISKQVVAKDPNTGFQKKMKELVDLMKKTGFKVKQKNRQQGQQYALMDYTLTIFGQIANVFVTRNEGGLGSKTPLKIMAYIPAYDGMLYQWDKYIAGVEKINKFIEQVKKIDQDFLK